MSEQANAVKAPEVLKPFTAKIGEAEIEFEQLTVKKGRSLGLPFLAPKESAMNLDVAIQAYGKDKIWSEIVWPELRRFSLGATKELLADETVNSDTSAFREKFMQFFTELSQQGQTIKALKERANELLEELAGARPAMAMVNGKLSIDPSHPDTMKFLDISQKLQKVQAAIENKRSKDDDESPANNNAPAAPAVA